MGVFDRQFKTAKRLLDKYGETAVFSHYEATEVDPSKPWLSSGKTTSEHNVKCVFLPNTSNLKQTLEKLGNSTTPSSDTVGYITGISFKPTMNDFITRGDGTKYTVLNGDAINPNGEGNILWVLELKG